MPPKAAKVPEKVAPKDEAQIVYINMKFSAPAPLPPVISDSSSVGVESISKSGLKPPKGKTASTTVAAAETTSEPAPEPAAPAVPEIKEISFEILGNLICRSDIFIDYVQRQAVKLLQEKLTKELEEQVYGEAMQGKLKKAIDDLTAKSSADLILRDTTGADIVFREVSIFLFLVYILISLLILYLLKTGSISKCID